MNSAAFESGAVPVGAGLPAKRPVQAMKKGGILQPPST
ncbi:hypothetical protein RK21_03543 [Pseudomonas plecoglossicida]|nr:hypothetical protein RK21_03543 [Pseudomonas plecoglossicida]